MSSILKVDTIQDQDGNNIINENAGTITIGKSGDTVNLASGATAGFRKVLQVVTAVNESTVSTTSTSYVDITSVTASITPNSTSNKIMVIYSSDALYTLVSATNVNYFHRVLRDATEISQRLLTAASASGGLQARGAMCITILDSPNTTSSVTYKAQHKLSSGSSTGSTLDTSITLMEIAG